MSYDLTDALTFARRAHAGQTRRDGVTPYLVHPVTVLCLMRETFGPQRPALEAAALLHDTVEDCGVTADELAGRFDADVAALVVAVTKSPRPAGVDKAAHHAADYARLYAPGRCPDEVIVLKASDRLANLSELPPRGDAFTERYLADTQVLIDTMAGRCPPALRDALARVGGVL